MKSKNYRWRILTFLFFATTINYIDRQVIGILKPFIEKDPSIGFSEADYGYIVSAFQITYAIGLLLTGRFLDKFGTRIGYFGQSWYGALQPFFMQWLQDLKALH